MPHVYDTGLAVPQRTAIRSAIVSRLSLLKKPTLYLQAVDVLPGRLDGGDDETLGELANTLQGRTPAMLVALGRGDATAAGMPASTTRLEIEVLVYIANAHARGTVTGRLAGDAAAADVTKDPGIETMIEHAEELLLGRSLGVAGVSEMRLDSEEPFYSDDLVTLWALTFKVRAMRDVNHNRSITTILTEIEASHLVEGADPANPVSATRTLLEAP